MKKLVITGLIRNEKSLKDFLDQAYSYLIEGKIEVILSTWKGEVERNPGIQGLIDKFQIKLILQEQPNLLVGDHLAHQLLSLDAVLLTLNDEDFIYKTRTDHLLIDEFKLFCELEPEKSLLPSLSRFKFGIIEAFLSQPFYINDMTFSGVVSDLKKLTKLPILSPITFANLSAEQFIWGMQFAETFQAIQYFFRLNFGMPYNDRSLSYEVQNFLIGNKTFIAALSIYLWVLGNNFKIYERENKNQPTEDSIKCRLEDLLFSNQKIKGLRFHEATQMNIVCSDSIINKILKGFYISSDFGVAIQNHFKKLDASNGNFQNILLDSSFFSEANAFVSYQNTHNLPPIKAFKMIGNVIESSSIAPDWKVIGSDVDTIRQLEEKILELRRAIERLTL